MSKSRDLANLGSNTAAIATDTEVASTVSAHASATSSVHGTSGNVVGTANTQTLTRKTFTAPAETIVTWNGIGGNNTVYVTDAAVIMSTVNASANISLNFYAESGIGLNSSMNNYSSVTVSVLVPNGATPYYVNSILVDGSAPTVKWSGGTAPTAGNANSTDAYSFTIMKTANATFTVLAAGPIKYA